MPRSAIVALAALFALSGALAFASRAEKIVGGHPFDFELNWVAAHRLVDGEPLYDRGPSRAEAIARVGARMRESNHGPFSSFIGLPAVALVHVPFTLLSLDDAVATFRLLALIGMLAAIAITSWVLPKRARLPAVLAVSGALMMSWPFAATLWVGQGNEFLMILFAVAVVGADRGRWRVVGLALGIAAVLKLTPVLIVVYLVARGRRQVGGYALASAGTISALAFAVGQPPDSWIWVRQVLPVASQGSLYVGNQSLVGWFARVTTSVPNLGALWTLGTVRYLSWILLAGLGVTLWRIRRYRPVVADEIAAAILVVLLAATLSWDHYFVWAFVPLTMMCDPRRWRAVSPSKCLAWAVMLAVAVGLFATRVPIPSVAEVRADGWVRWYGSPYAVATILLLTVAIGQLRAGRRSAVADEPPSDASASPASFDGPELSLSQR